MSLSVFSANRVEFLQQQLAHHLAHNPLQSVLQPEIIVVPTYAMARWLNLQLARDLGIAANIDYPSPSTWIWDLISDKNALLPYHRDNLQWKLFEILPSMLRQKSFETLEQYINQATDEVPLWQLCGQIASNFESYLKYRPELTRQWKDNSQTGWQAQLWRMLCEDLSIPDPVELIDRLLLNPASFENGIKNTPERVSLFALSSLPAIYIDVIHRMSDFCDITLYLHSPTYHYWADLISKKSAAQKRLIVNDSDFYFETGNDLLASWGKQGQALQDLLLTHSELSQNLPEKYDAPGKGTMLQRIQQSIFDLDTEVATIEVDDSIQIDICHSPMRECQVLHDNLLEEFNLNPQLNPEDVLVMIPEISSYAPTIEAVFHARLDQANYIPWNISDITTSQQHPLVLSFLQLLDISNSRFKQSEILSLLDVDNICHRFGIDSTNRETIKYYLSQTRLRWGIDASHKESLGQKPVLQNTWKQSKERLFAGYAMKGIDLWNDIAPIDHLESDSVVVLSKFWFFFDKLTVWSQRLKSDQSVEQWQITLNNILEDFYIEDEHSIDSLRIIRETIGQLNSHDKSRRSISFIQYWMTQQLSSSESPGRLFSGGVTFCGMRPMRSLPFKVVCLLGMNDGAFPRRDSRNSFDLMKDKWRPGDPASRDEDRYLMLETLLSSREKLIISYCGRDNHDNSEQQPSIVVKELTDYVDGYFLHKGNSPGFSELITTRHALQAFSPKNYQNTRKGFDAFWYELATFSPGASSTGESSRDVRSNRIAPVFDPVLSATDLIQFLAHPIEYFFRHQLGIQYHSDISEEDNESFSIGGLELWSIKQQMVENFLTNTDTGIEQWSAQGILPHGEAASIELEAVNKVIDDLIIPARSFLSSERTPRFVKVGLRDGLTLQYNCPGYYVGSGLLHINSARLKPKQLFAFWVEHLLLSSDCCYQTDEKAILLSRDEQYSFSPIDSSKALEILQSYVDIFTLGQSFPLAVFPLSTFTWAFTQNVNKTLLSWRGNSFSKAPCDIEDNYIQIYLRSEQIANPIEQVEFESLSNQLYRDFRHFSGNSTDE